MTTGLNASELFTMEVTPKHAKAAAEMTDEKLLKLWVVNGFLAALGGRSSMFYGVQAAVAQEIKRRGLKAEGMLS